MTNPPVAKISTFLIHSIGFNLHILQNMFILYTSRIKQFCFMSQCPIFSGQLTETDAWVRDSWLVRIHLQSARLITSHQAMVIYPLTASIWSLLKMTECLPEHRLYERADQQTVRSYRSWRLFPFFFNQLLSQPFQSLGLGKLVLLLVDQEVHTYIPCTMITDKPSLETQHPQKYIT